MVTNLQSESFRELLESLDDEQRAMLEESPRQNRLPLYAQFARKTETEAILDIGNACQINVLESFELAANATDRIPLRLIHEYQCFPFEESTDDEGESAESDEQENSSSGPVRLITLWPPEPSMNEWIFAVSGRQPDWYLGSAKAIINCITQNFGVGSDSLTDSDIETDEVDRESEESEDENAALIRFVNEVIQKAVEDRATDIHFEPLKESLQIRYRIDGELVPIRVPDNLIRFQSAIISRLKIMAKLNISEKRRPQDGRINYKSGTDELDIRISTMPTMYGESVSLRLLSQKNQPLSFQEVGMSDDDQVKIKRVLELPHGIILVTGPTGSGKSTSLNAFIRHINSPGRRIITIEDPVEYEVSGVNQTQVRPEIGYTFAGALRHVLRQDPDIIMVGEIRDQETAEIAIRASMTGHLVLSTLHTNDAPGALTRLIDMEVEPFLIASAVEMVIAQRLVRRLCPKCARPHNHDQRFLTACLKDLQIEPTDEDLRATTWDPDGCDFCRNLGFRGRVGLFEILRINDQIHEMVVKQMSAGEIRRVATEHGMVSLQESGWNQVKAGYTSFSEIMRYSKITEEL